MKKFDWENKNNELIEMSKHQYTEINHLEIIMKANETGIAKLSINNYGSFKSFIITGSFTTLESAANDDGICRTLLSLEDTGLSRKITNSFIPANLLLTMGRIKSHSTGDPSNEIFMPLKFEYFFEQNSDIQVNWKNNAGTENKVNIVFWGTRYDKRK